MGTYIAELPYAPLAQVFAHIRNMDQAIFLDSSEVGAQGTHSIAGVFPTCTIAQAAAGASINGEPTDEDFFSVLSHELERRHEPNRTGLPLIGGCLGYLSYDFGRELMGVPTRHAPACSGSGRMPLAQMTFYDILLIEDLRAHTLYLCAQGEKLLPHDALAWAHGLVEQARAESSSSADLDSATFAPERHAHLAPFTSPFTQRSYQDALERMVEYMRAGHIYVANMTQKLTLKTRQSPWEIYRYLRAHNPAPFSAYLHGMGFDVCCSSMERFLHVRNGQVTTRPIKGTRKRGATPEEDERLRQELFKSPKDNSELLMIVDLERNDLAASCKPGTVRTEPAFTVEDYPTVFHLVATVTGQLKDNATAVDAVRAAFPGGSITGCPKRRAMEIIDELEKSPRGLYTGSIGYFSANGDADLNIVIRTLTLQEDAAANTTTATLGVGGGITAESDFDFEYEETLQKARALREAAGEQDQQGLRAI